MKRKPSVQRGITFFIAALFAVMFSFSANAASCKGKSRSSCSANSDCSWVDGYKRKDGVKVSGHCRAKPGKASGVKSDRKASSGDKKKKSTAKKHDKKKAGKKSDEHKKDMKKSKDKKKKAKKSKDKKAKDKNKKKKDKKKKDKKSKKDKSKKDKSKKDKSKKDKKK